MTPPSQPPSGGRFMDIRTPRNTTRAMREDPAEALLMFADATGPGGSARAIAAQEAAGQREMVNSTVIPTRLNGCAEDELTALGFTLGDIVADDPLFRRATLPDGWRREGSDHQMWSYIVDQDGYRRCAVFYKAAWYDRDAFLSLDTLYGYVSTCLYENTVPVARGDWATPEALLEAIEQHREQNAEKVVFWREEHPDAPGASEYAAEHAEKVKRCEALAADLRKAATA